MLIVVMVFAPCLADQLPGLPEADLLAPGDAAQDDAPPEVTAQADSISQALVLLREVIEGIHEAYVEPISVEVLLESALKGVRGQLDPHTKVLSAEEYQAVRSRQGTATGIGITLGADAGRTRIRTVRPGSPAEHAGLQPGDLLLAVNGIPVRAANLEQTTDLLRGALGSVVRLRVASPEQAPREIAVQRDTVTREALSERMLCGGRIGYLRIHRFARGVADRVEATLTGWVSGDIKGIIIDLRDNPGGFIDEAARTADLLLPIGAGIVRTVGRLPEENGIMVSRRQPIVVELPMVLLVDSLTASSAEIFAGALKGQPGVTLLGEPTYGKRTVQRLIPTSNGGALKVTASFFCTPSDPEFAVDSPDWGGASDAAQESATAPGERPRTDSLHARGRRLEPDRCLESPDPTDPAERLTAQGLLPRFSAEATMGEQDCVEPSYWASPRPHLGDGSDPWTWLRGCQGARGFDRWCGRLRSRLRDWGCAEELPATPALRRAWFIDWVTERWGPQMGELAALELDPWIGAAVESLVSRRLPSDAAAPSAVTQVAVARRP